MLKNLAIILFLTAPGSLAQEEADRHPGETTSRMVQIEEGAARPQPAIPTPQETYWGRGEFSLSDKGILNWTVEMRGRAAGLAILPAELNRRVTKQFAVAPAATSGSGPRVLFMLDARAAPVEGEKIAATLRGLSKEAYVLQTARVAERSYILVAGNSETALWHGMATLVQLISRQDGALVFPEVEIVDYPQMEQRGILVDVGGQGFMVGPSRWNLDRWKDFADWMVDHKFNSLWIEFIGSGRLMGNLNMDAGEWAGFPLALKSYPQLVCRDRPIRRWDAAQHRIVQDTFTAPNVQHDFVAQLIDYAQARGVKCYLAIGHDYFANQLPVVMHIPANDPANAPANKVYDDILTEIVQRYRNASGVVLITIENKNVPEQIIQTIIRRVSDASKIIHSINPKMEIGSLPDYLEWQPNQLDDLRLFKHSLPDVFLAYSPHREPQQKSWQRVHGNVWRYMNYTQYAWDHIAYIFPGQVRDEIAGSYADGYRKIVTQGWYFDVFSMNYLALAEYSWNLSSCPLNDFWRKALERQFGARAAEPMRTALEHTRFDVRFDIIARSILEDKIDREFTYWDMYVMHRISRLEDSTLKDLEDDAAVSLQAAQSALPLVPDASREMVEIVVTSAERRLYLATSARHLLKARALEKAGNLPAARQEMAACVRDGEKLYQAATKLGIEFPMAVHDDELLEKYRRISQAMSAPHP